MVLLSTPSYSMYVHWVISSTSWLHYHQYVEPRIYRQRSFLPHTEYPVSCWIFPLGGNIHLQAHSSKTKPASPLDFLFWQWFHQLPVATPLSPSLAVHSQQPPPDPSICVPLPCHYSSVRPITFHLGNFNSLLNRLPVSSFVWDPPLPWFLPTDYKNPPLKTRLWCIALKIMIELFNKLSRLCMNQLLLI